MEAETLSGSAVTLLIIDDEPFMTDLFREAMTSRGYRVVEASGGAEALRIVATQTVDLAITDMTMPGMDGVALAYALNAQAPHLPVLIATGHDADAGQLGLPGNVIGIIKKPYKHRELAEQIREVLAAKHHRGS